MWCDKCLKSAFAEDRSTSNMENGSRHCSELNDSTFAFIIDPCEANSGSKNVSE